MESAGLDSQKSRRAFWLFAIPVVFAAVTAVVWWVWLPHYRPGLEPGESYGVDVSNHQGEIDWNRVAGDNIDFAYVKATEGGDFVDMRFSDNWEGASAASLQVGAYHFFTLCRSGEEQAMNFLSVARPDGDLPPALDLEFPGNCADRPSVEWVHHEVARWIDSVEERSRLPVLLYVQREFDEVYKITETFEGRLWHRQILRRPSGDRWTFWQVSYRSGIDGIDGGVDLNVRRPAR